MFVTIFPEVAQNSQNSLSFPCSEKSPSIPGLWPPCIIIVDVSAVAFFGMSLITGSNHVLNRHRIRVIMLIIGLRRSTAKLNHSFSQSPAIVPYRPTLLLQPEPRTVVILFESIAHTISTSSLAMISLSQDFKYGEL